MTQIVPAGGMKMKWVQDPEQAISKTAQGLFEDDPQLDAIKDLPGMQDGIAELNTMSEGECEECPMNEDASDLGGAIDQALEKVKDAALDVADAAKEEIKQDVTEALAGKEIAMVADPVKGDVKSENDNELEEFEFEIPVSDEADDDDKPDDKADDDEDKKSEKEEEIPGVEGDTEDGVEKEGDEEKSTFAAGKGMRRLAELSSDEQSELRHYWKDLLGFPSEYVDSMLKNYKA